jgi:GNAT superfamily N-acetyltransferase
LLREEEQNLPAGTVYQMTAAVTDRDYLVGYTDAWHLPWMPEGHFRLLIRVDPAYRRQGIGSRLYDVAREFMLAQGAIHLGASVRDDQPDWLRFATQRGYTIERHTFTSVLDLAAFDPAAWMAVVTKVEAQGLRFVTLAELGNTPEAQRRLYDLNRTLALQAPGQDTFPDWDTFRNDVFGAHWFRPDAQLLVLDGDQWVGLGAVGLHPESNAAYNAFTGVLESHRGRGIAQALKVRGIMWAKTQSMPIIRTDNDSLNAPMLAVNRKLGYRPEIGFYKLVQPVETNMAVTQEPAA